MVWFVQPMQIADKEGKSTGRWRMTATSDEDGGGPYGDVSHDHASAEEAQECERCDEFVSQWSGFPSKRRQREMDEARERKEYERLKEKFENSP